MSRAPRKSSREAAELHRRGRNIDRSLGVDQAIALMRDEGQALQLQFKSGQRIWTLSGGGRLDADVADALTNHPSIVDCGDSLFSFTASQTWRFTDG
jgi:hypothetical protein